MDNTNTWYFARIDRLGVESAWVSYDGWSAKYCECVPLASKRLAPFRTYAAMENRRANSYSLDLTAAQAQW